jgi:predicted dehydrogenase
MPLNIAIAGFGRMARSYCAPALKRLEPDASYFIADPAAPSCEAARRAFPQAQCFGTTEELLDIALDAALIASPPTAHFDAWRFFAERGVPVFMEKPFPLPQDIGRARDLAQRAPSPLMINFNRRFWPPYRQLLEAAKAGAIGAPSSASLELITDNLRWKAATDHRAATSEGGVLQDLGGHVVDFAIRLFGSLPAQVSATESSARDGRLSLQLGWPGGRSASCLIGYDKAARETVRVLGSDGALAINNPHGRLWRDERSSTGFSAQLADLVSIGTYGFYPERTLMRWTTHAALQAFLHGLRTGEPLSPGLGDAIGVARVLDAAEQSIAAGNRIALGA